MATPFRHGGTNVPRPGKIIYWNFSSNHNRLTNYKTYNDYKSAQRPKKGVKLKLERKIISGLKDKREDARDSSP